MSEKENLDEHLKLLEIKIKEKELNKKWFENPINGTIFLGFITIVFNLIINSCNNKNLSDLEKDKFEYTVYLKALEANSQEEAAKNIEFYEGLGLIKTNKITLKKIEDKSLPIYNNSYKFRFNEIYTDVFVLDDINGDNKKDTVVYRKPKLIDDGGECLGECIISFEFSNKKIPTLKINHPGSALIESCRDLNGDNINDVLIINRGMNGSWYGCDIYSLKNNKWVLIFDKGFIQDDGLDEIYTDRIINEKNTFYFLNDSLTDNGNLKVKIKI